MVEFTWAIFDLIALVVLIIAVTRCAHSGFVKGVLGLASAALAAIGAFLLSAPIAAFIYERFLRGVIVAAVYNQITEQMETGGAGLIPTLLAGIIVLAAGAIDPIAAPELGPALESVIDAAVAQPVIMLLRVLFGSILFFIFLFISRRVVGLFRFVNHIPLVGPVNSFLGGVLGVGWAALILWGMALVASFYIALTTGGGELINADNLAGGYLFSFFFRRVG